MHYYADADIDGMAAHKTRHVRVHDRIKQPLQHTYTPQACTCEQTAAAS
jgi:hypothetical protein